MDINRLKRVESLILSELAKLLHAESHDSLLQLTNITDIKVSADLSCAKVYVVARNESDTKQTIKTLNQKARYLRYRLAQRIRDLRKIPELRFYYDNSVREGNRIEELLKAIRDQESN